MLTTLVELGRLDEAALWFGGCEASSVMRLPVQTLPAELACITRGEGDPRLLALPRASFGLGPHARV